MKPKMKKLSKAEEFLKLIFEEQIPSKEMTQLQHGKVLSNYSRSEKLDSLFTALDTLGEMSMLVEDRRVHFLFCMRQRVIVDTASGLSNVDTSNHQSLALAHRRGATGSVVFCTATLVFIDFDGEPGCRFSYSCSNQSLFASSQKQVVRTILKKTIKQLWIAALP
jgi:hypothetical protein